MQLNWSLALATAGGMVERANQQALVVFGSTGVNRKLERDVWEGQMSEARGAVAILRVMAPGHPQVEALWCRLNHSPVLAVGGPDHKLPDPQIQ